MKPFHITIYTRKGCSLCDKAKAIVEKVAQDYPIQLELFDITTDPEIEAKYTDVIPVIHIDGEEVFVSKMAELWLRRELDGRIRSGDLCR
ncbi:glutaredoxin family protein [Microaerobacter geothermalis]|uniref:glutaredoxin family protein n=1 Tax=Microaerobacter geothermalis TaxID=674972 RepID=UPI001F2C7C5D|nr:glutaredoxin family protein [Microaerobacter geothermalis]MCF6095386.1 glutaredoxin family protein [Microaerobacter geothermalis]